MRKRWRAMRARAIAWAGCVWNWGMRLRGSNTVSKLPCVRRAGERVRDGGPCARARDCVGRVCVELGNALVAVQHRVHAAVQSMASSGVLISIETVVPPLWVTPPMTYGPGLTAR